MNSKKIIQEIKDSGYDSFLLKIYSAKIWIDWPEPKIELVSGSGTWKEWIKKRELLDTFKYNKNTIEVYTNDLFRRKDTAISCSIIEAKGTMKVNYEDERYNINIKYHGGEVQKIPSPSPTINKYGKVNRDLVKLIERIESINMNNKYQRYKYLKLENDRFYFGLDYRHPLNDKEHMLETQKNTHISSYNHWQGYNKKHLFQEINPSKINIDIKIFDEYCARLNILQNNKEIENKIKELEAKKQ